MKFELSKSIRNIVSIAVLSIMFSCQTSFENIIESLLSVSGTELEYANPEFLYRFDRRSPEEILKAGGFLAKGINTNIEDHLSYRTFNSSSFISTTKDFKVAWRFFHAYSESGYIYSLKNEGSNRVDISLEYLNNYKNPYFYDYEVLFKNKIPIEQIHSCWEAQKTTTLREGFFWGTRRSLDFKLGPQVLFRANKTLNLVKKLR